MLSSLSHLATILLCILAVAHAAHPLEEWYERAPLPTSLELQDISFDGNQYVLLDGDPNGRALVSKDGRTFGWQDLGLPRPLEATRILHANGSYVLLSGGHLWHRASWEAKWEKVPRAIDAIDFHYQVLPAPCDIQDSVWSPKLGVFVVVGGKDDAGQAWSSKDAETWRVESLPGFTSSATGIAWDGSRFIACGEKGQLATSTDGTSWLSMESSVTESFAGIEWADGQYVATSTNGSVLTSTSGGIQIHVPIGQQKPGVIVWPERSTDMVRWTREGMRVYLNRSADWENRFIVNIPDEYGNRQFIRLRWRVVRP